MDSSKQPRQGKNGPEVSNIESYESLYCRFTETVASKLWEYTLYLVAEQEVRWDEGGGQPADDHFSKAMGMRTITYRLLCT
jgi:hypothetical protein